ncbi:MAG: biotin--protein ligase [Chloroflexota bacterium]
MHHGEYKTPGGKLVAVDFEIADGRLTGVLVHGDFFLYPDEAFEDLAAAIEGAPAGEPEDAVARRIRARLRPGAELLGTSPEGIAIAVTRALAAGTGSQP